MTIPLPGSVTCATTRKLAGRLILIFALLALAGLRAGNAAVVGLWRFDEASGNALDSSGNGNTGILVGSNTARVTSQSGFGSAIQFVNDLTESSYVQVPGNFSLLIGANAGDPWSVTTWTYEHDDGFGALNAEYGTMLHYQKTLSDELPYSDPVYGLSIQSGATYDPEYWLWTHPNPDPHPFKLGTGVNPTPYLETWTHVAYVYDGSDFLLYLNGSLAFQQTVGAADLNYDGYNGRLQIGGAPGFGLSRNYHGMLDDVAIFNEALTSSDLAQIMAGNFVAFIDPVPQPPTAEWQTSTFGMWQTTSNWDPFVAPNSTAIMTVFGGQTETATTVVNDQAVTVRGIQFNHTLPYAIAGPGSITLDSGGVGNASISVFDAGAAVTHEIQIPVMLASDTDLAVAADTVLEFDHRLELNGQVLNLSGEGMVRVNNRSAMGTSGTLNNAGNLGGVGTITGDLNNTMAGTLIVTIGGTGAYDVQGFEVTGTASLAGTLAILLDTSFTPTDGDMFTALTAGNLIDNGLVLGGDSQDFSYSILDNSLVLTYGTALAGDFDADGDVDGADFLAWQQGFGTTYDANDLSDWQTNFGTEPGTIAAGAVPEPAGWLLLLAAGIAGLLRHRPAVKGCLAGVVLAGFLAASVEATVLTFSGEYGGDGAMPGTYAPYEDGSVLVSEYGDRVSGATQHDIQSDDFGGIGWYHFFYGNNGEGYTPNVVVDYPASSTGVWPAFRYWSSYGGFNDAIYPNSEENGTGLDMWGMTFTADPGVQVLIDSFEVSRAGSFSNSLTVSIYEGDDPQNPGALLWSSGSTFIDPNAPVVFMPNVSENTVSIVYTFEDYDPAWDWAIDNVQFSQIGGGLPTHAEWAVDGSGIWSVPGHWAPDFTPILIPQGNDRTAVFGGVTTSPSTVVLDKAITVKKVQFDHTVSYSLAGSGELMLAADTGNATIEVVNAGGAIMHQLTAPTRLGSPTDVILAEGTMLQINNRLALGGFDLIKSGNGTLQINNVVESGGGTITALDGTIAGTGSIAGDLANDGATVAPGNSPGILTILGAYRQSAAGTLRIELGGSERGTDYDVLDIAGTALFDGILEIVLWEDFVPTAGDRFDILDFRAATGEFAEVQLPAGFLWDTSGLTRDGTLAVLRAVPEPATGILGGLVVVAGFAYRRRWK